MIIPSLTIIGLPFDSKVVYSQTLLSIMIIQCQCVAVSMFTVIFSTYICVLRGNSSCINDYAKCEA